MKLTTVIGSVNNNPKYYKFIPKQIFFWGKLNIKFIAIFVGESIPEELSEYKNNIILWDSNLNINTAYVGQNIRMYYAALIELPDDELIMLTDMDMLPTNNTYYTSDLGDYKFEDFIYYRFVDHVSKQIYMCYNSAHPKIWGKMFGINSKEDVKNKLYENYMNDYNGIPGSTGWFTDQEVMYKKLVNYEHLIVLDRPIKRLETWVYYQHLNNGEKDFIKNYDDVHFHRDYIGNEQIILDAERQISNFKFCK